MCDGAMGNENHLTALSNETKNPPANCYMHDGLYTI